MLELGLLYHFYTLQHQDYRKQLIMSVCQSNLHNSKFEICRFFLNQSRPCKMDPKWQQGCTFSGGSHTTLKNTLKEQADDTYNYVMSGEIDIFANNTQRKGKQAVLKRMVLLLLMLQLTRYPFTVSPLSITDPQLCPRRRRTFLLE